MRSFIISSVLAIISLLAFQCNYVELAAVSNKQVEKITIDREFAESRVFPLSIDNIRLLGGKYSLIRTGKLPIWFDFEAFKKKYKKNYTNEEENIARNHAYIKTCIRVLKARILFRILAGVEDTFITRDADRLPSDKIIDVDNSGKYLTDSTRQDLKAASQDEVSFSLSLEPDFEDDEDVIRRAKRLLLAELDSVESRNQLVNYLKAFEKEEYPFM